MEADITKVIYTPEQIQERVAELAKQARDDYAAAIEEDSLLLVAILKGAFVFMADFSRALDAPARLEFMAISSYGASTSSSGVVRILKDLDRDIAGKHVLLIEDIVDSGLTLSWLKKNLATRNPASIEIASMFRKTDAVKVPLDVKYLGFEVPNEFVVGYGLDFAEKYRTLPYLGVLDPKVYGG